jgi:hypothetical protein
MLNVASGLSMLMCNCKETHLPGEVSHVTLCPELGSHTPLEK